MGFDKLPVRHSHEVGRFVPRSLGLAWGDLPMRRRASTVAGHERGVVGCSKPRVQGLVCECHEHGSLRTSCVSIVGERALQSLPNLE